MRYFSTSKSFFFFQDTLARYLYRRTGRPSPHLQGRFLRNVSQRQSFSNNSQSVNTCSSICSTQFNNLNYNSIRSYMDTEILASSLHSLQRPLVVSFRRIPKETNSSSFTSESSSNFNHDYSDYCSIQHQQQSTRKQIDATLKRFPRTTCIQNYSKACYDYTNDKESYSSVSFDDKTTENFYHLNKETSSSIHSEQRDECMILESRKRIRRLDEKHIKSRTKRKFESFKELKLAIRKDKSEEIGKCHSEENFIHNSTNSTIYATPKTFSNEKTKVPCYNTKLYKSPYQSPELSTNYKKLEDNLRLILEDLVLYPTCSQETKNRNVTISHHQSTKYFGRCRSLPSLADKRAFPLVYQNTNIRKFYKKELSINSQSCTENGSASTGSCDSLHQIASEQIKLVAIQDNDMHPLNILIKESEKTFG